MKIQKALKLFILSILFLGETTSAMFRIEQTQGVTSPATCESQDVSPMSDEDAERMAYCELVDNMVAKLQHIDFNKLNWICLHKFLYRDISPEKLIELTANPGKNFFSELAMYLCEGKKLPSYAESCALEQRMRNNIESFAEDGDEYDNPKSSASLSSSCSDIFDSPFFTYTPPFNDIVDAQAYLALILIHAWEEFRDECKDAVVKPEKVSTHGSTLKQIHDAAHVFINELEKNPSIKIKKLTITKESRQKLWQSIPKQLCTSYGQINLANSPHYWVRIIEHELQLKPSRTYASSQQLSNLLLQLLVFYPENRHKDIILLVVTMNAEEIEYEEGKRLKPEISIRRAFCQKFSREYSRAQNSNSESIARNLANIAVYVLKFNPFCFFDDSASINPQQGKEQPQDDTPSVKKLADQCTKRTKECIRSLSREKERALKDAFCDVILRNQLYLANKLRYNLRDLVKELLSAHLINESTEETIIYQQRPSDQVYKLLDFFRCIGLRGFPILFQHLAAVDADIILEQFLRALREAC